MSNRMETDLFFEAFQSAETVLENKQTLLQHFDGEEVNRSDLCDATDALQALLQQTQSLHQFYRSLHSDEAENAAVLKIEELQSKLREARKQTNRSNRKAKRLKRKLAHMEERYDRLCDGVIEEERLKDKASIEPASHPPYPEVEYLSSDEWSETGGTPPDSPHLWKYECLEPE